MDSIESILSDAEFNPILSKSKDMIIATELMAPNDVHGFYEKEKLLKD